MSRPHPPMPGEHVERRRLDEMIRVDHAGEYGAVQIYRGQKAVFSRIEAKAHAARLISEMEAGEQEHLKTFDRLIAERRVRPTLMAPVWRVAGFGLGAITALMGEEAAHACTEAVEDVIEKHYGHQSDELEGVDIVFVPLDDGAVGHGRVLYRHQAREPIACDHEAAGVLRQVARKAHQRVGHLDPVLHL